MDRHIPYKVRRRAFGWLVRRLISRAPGKLTTWVSNDDIDGGTHNGSMDCPIARALRRRFPNATSVMVAGAYVTVAWERFGLRGTVQYKPDQTDEFIAFQRNFDRYNPVYPTSFTLTRTHSSVH